MSLWKKYKNTEVKQGSTIHYDLNSQSTSLGPRPPIIGLAHELGHADDFMNGRGVNWDKNNDNNVDDNEIDAVQKTENHAIEIENKVRKAMGEPLRPLDYFYNRKKKWHEKVYIIRIFCAGIIYILPAGVESDI